MTNKSPTTKPVCMDRQAIRARVDLIAHERGLLQSEIKKAKTCGDDALLDFARCHGLSIDWLILGDLRGRLRMARHRKQRQLCANARQGAHQS